MSFPGVEKWTNGGANVLLVKCVGKGGVSHGGFVWPKSGPVRPEKCSLEPDCNSGGLFGWPWGLRLGGGKKITGPDAVNWIVFEAPAEQVVNVSGDKAKVAASNPADVIASVVYYGDLSGALEFTKSGRDAYLLDYALRAEKHSTGDRGSAASTGDRGSAASTGNSGSAASTGNSGSAASTGYSGSAASTGYSGSAASTGNRGSAASTGYRGSAASTGDSGSAASTGYRGSAASTGDSGSAASTGNSGSAASTGDSGSAASTGDSGIASLSGENGLIEIGPHSLGAVTASVWRWLVRPGAVVVCRWHDGGNKWPAKLLVADDLGLADGEIVGVVNGEIQK